MVTDKYPGELYQNSDFIEWFNEELDKKLNEKLEKLKNDNLSNDYGNYKFTRKEFIVGNKIVVQKTVTFVQINNDSKVIDIARYKRNS